MAQAPVVTKIIQRPQKGKLEIYEEWLKEIIPVAKSFKGHQGVNIIRPHKPHEDYTILLHFQCEEALMGWLGSAERKSLLDKIRPHLSGDEKIETETGLEYWFTPPEVKPLAPPYKQFLITLSAIYPLTQIIPPILKPGFEVLHIADMPLLKGFFIAAAIVGLMVYVIMPRYTKLMAFWLYRS